MKTSKQHSPEWLKWNRAMHGACNARQINNDQRKLTIKSVTGKESSVDCTARELRAVVNEINKNAPQAPRKKKRTFADKAVHSKVRALWVTLYNLGAINTPDFDALETMAKRVCLGTKGNENIVFKLSSMDSKGTFKLIEALKAMCRRAGVNWSPYHKQIGGRMQSVDQPRCRVIEAQWMKLHPRAGFGGMFNEIGNILNKKTPYAHTLLSEGEADQIIQHFGKLIREGKRNG